MSKNSGYKESIIQAATQLFHERGFSRTTTDEIAREANITKRTLYRYMGSKEAILQEIHEQFLGRLLSQGDLPASPHERFDALIANYVDTVISHRNEIRVFFEEQKHLSDSARQRVVARRDDHEQLLRETIAAGIVQGIWRDFDVFLATEAVLGAVASLYGWYHLEGPVGRDDISRLISTLFIEGLAGRDEERAGTTPAMAGTAADARPLSENDLAWMENPVLQKVLSAATEMFRERGYDNSSTRDLADAAGLSKSALYYYIPSKEAVLFQLNLQLTLEGIEALQAICRETPDPVAALRRIFVWQSVSNAANLGALRALTHELRFLDVSHRERITALRSEYARLFLAVFRAASGLPDTTETKVISFMLMGMLNFMSEWYLPSGRLGPEQIGQGFFDLVWNGLAPKGCAAPGRH